MDSFTTIEEAYETRPYMLEESGFADELFELESLFWEPANWAHDIDAIKKGSAGYNIVPGYEESLVRSITMNRKWTDTGYCLKLGWGLKSIRYFNLCFPIIQRAVREGRILSRTPVTSELVNSFTSFEGYSYAYLFTCVLPTEVHVTLIHDLFLQYVKILGKKPLVKDAFDCCAAAYVLMETAMYDTQPVSELPKKISQVAFEMSKDNCVRKTSIHKTDSGIYVEPYSLDLFTCCATKDNCKHKIPFYDLGLIIYTEHLTKKVADNRSIKLIETLDDDEYEAAKKLYPKKFFATEDDVDLDMLNLNEVY